MAFRTASYAVRKRGDHRRPGGPMTRY